eukprot:gene9529-17274_t
MPGGAAGGGAAAMAVTPVVHGGGGGYAPKGGPSTVTFHVIVNPESVRAGEVLTLHGSIPELGKWNEVGIPMRRSDARSDVWEVTVDLPIGMSEKDTRGLFDFKHAIQTESGEQIMEGGLARSADKMFQHFYSAFNTLVGTNGERFRVGDRIQL